MLSKSDVSSLAVVKRGRQRRLIVKNMEPDKPLMVSEIERRTNEYIKKSKEEEGENIRLSDVSRTLKTLVGLGLAKCLNPARRKGDKGILYQLTGKGRKIQALL